MINKITYPILLLTFLSSENVTAAEINKEELLKPINNIFDAMRAHDGKKLLAQFTENAVLDRATKLNKSRTSDLAKFAEFISKSEKHLDEQLFNIKFHQSDNLASVWTPFAFYIDGKLSHCGVNSFQLIRQNDKWKIHYLIDNAHQGNCQDFIAAHKTL